MTTKEKMQLQIQAWKTLKTEEDRQAFLAQLKSEIEGKTPDQWKESMKALQALAGELREKVRQLPLPESQEEILISPGSTEEADLIKALLKRMAVPFETHQKQALRAAA